MTRIGRARPGTPERPAGLACFAGLARRAIRRAVNAARSGGPRLIGLLCQQTDPEFGFRCDSDLPPACPCVRGAVSAGCQENIARRTPELVPVLPTAVHYALEVWLVMHKDLKTTVACACCSTVSRRAYGLRHGESPARRVRPPRGDDGPRAVFNPTPARAPASTRPA